MNRFDSDLLDQLAKYLIPDGFPDTFTPAFPVVPGGTLTANVSTLSETGQLGDKGQGLMVWTEATDTALNG